MLTRFRVELVNKLTRQQLPILSSAPSLTRRNLASKREEEEGREKDFVARQGLFFHIILYLLLQYIHQTTD